MKQGVFLISLLLLLPFQAWTQLRKPASIAELSVYTGPDREQLLYAGAKSEGKVVWYTSLAGDSYKAIARGFEAKYSGVRLEAYRAGGSELVPRMIEETKARRLVVDMLEMTLDSLMVSQANNLLVPMVRLISQDIRMGPRNRPTRDWRFGPSCANPIMASDTTKISSQRARFPGASMGCSTLISKENSGSPMARAQTRLLERC